MRGDTDVEALAGPAAEGAVPPVDDAFFEPFLRSTELSLFMNLDKPSFPAGEPAPGEGGMDLVND